MDRTADRIAASVEAMLVRELLASWAQLNATHFNGRMRPPVLELARGTHHLGEWRRRERTIRIARNLVAEQTWGVVLEVLKHEMAHQYVDEVLGVHDQPQHGPAFRELCRRLAIDPAAAGLPVAHPQGSDRERVMRKIQRLLALAESPNAHEAQAAMNAAHRLMLRHNIAWVNAAERARYAFRQIGPIKDRFSSHEKVLAGILARHFFVRAIWVPAVDPVRGRRGRVLELCGTPENLDIAAYVYDFLIQTGERLWRDHRKENGIPGNRDRRRFLGGVMVGFYEKLDGQAARCRQEGLVWMGDADLEDYVGRRYPYLRPARRSAMTTSNAWYHGRAAGRQIVLCRPVESGPRASGNLLVGPGE